MKPDPSPHLFITDLISTVWTPVFVALFVVVVLYALWPKNRSTFNEAARLPLQDD